VCVPMNPTGAMLKAAWADALGEDALGVWKTMIGVCLLASNASRANCGFSSPCLGPTESLVVGPFENPTAQLSSALASNVPDGISSDDPNNQPWCESGFRKRGRLARCGERGPKSYRHSAKGFGI
jgi:hypothetical protein